MSSTTKTPTGPVRRFLVLTLAVGAVMAALSAIALSPSTPLEVDGNAIDDPLGGEDWDVNNPIIQKDHISGEAGPETAFIQGGSKDERDISSAGITSQYWRWGDASVPDKDDLVHVLAKEYVTNGTKLLYFGATRAANNGDSAIGFWFLKKAVAFGSAPNFTGKHTDGDILITGDFGTAGVRDLNIFVWTGVADATDPVIPGVTLSYPLTLVKSSAGDPAQVFCDVGVASSNNSACASANTSPQTIPANLLDYRFKQGGANVFPADGKFPIGTFLEGGIDLGALGLPVDTCFSTVLAMTRTSASTTAQLKDLVLAPFGGCDIEIAKICEASVVHPSGAFITSTYTIGVTAKGGTVSNPGFEEDITLSANGSGFPRCKLAGSATWLATDQLVSLGATLAKDQTATASIQCDHTGNKMLNSATARASNGIDPLEDSVIGVECGLTTTPMLDVTKECDTVELVVDGETVQPKVCNKINVKNNGNELLVSLKVFDDPQGTNPAVQVTEDSITHDPVPTTLEPNDDFTVTHCYVPTTTNGGQTTPGSASFLNLAAAEAVGFLSGTSAQDSDEADCPLCPQP
ncbi:hypothetical protein [Lysobacter sp. CFH 32150]|uniref:hypothetical protein n=1 Tax=Lysobacter sp. CFH 32150 TaxID=2927128 RepID=UPI001FA6FD63|nr:hypothetical protein [Lysobacter sp. CFH 32150]MCI4568557.1 hypothetical protein [Lysobacter sp. CFH 32150]